MQVRSVFGGRTFVHAGIPLAALLCAALLSNAVLPARAASDPAAVETHCKNYYTQGKAIVEMAINKKIDAAEVEKKVKSLLADATWAALEYGKAFPTGSKLLQMVVDNVPSMEKLDFKSLESEWHDLKHFTKPGNEPGIDLKEEDNEHFTDPIHAIVHPLLVLKAAQNYAASQKEEDLKAVKEEMEEGLEQMEKLKQQLLKKK